MKTSNIMVSMVMDVFNSILCNIDISKHKEIEKVRNQLGERYTLEIIQKRGLVEGVVFGLQGVATIEVFISENFIHMNEFYCCCFYPYDYDKTSNKIKYGKRDLSKKDVNDFCRAFIPYILSEGEDDSGVLLVTNLLPEAVKCVFGGDNVAKNK